MNIDLYKRYVEHKQAGRKRAAGEAIRDFIASGRSAADREAWARGFLEAGEYGERIRHEIYEQLIFPALLDGYERQNSWSVSWLARTASNLYADPSLHGQVGFKSERQLFREAFELDPTDEIRRHLLTAYVHEFEYCQHEWPAGILCSMDSATIEECAEILCDVDFVRALDNGTHEPFLRQFEQRVNEYRDRLSRPTSGPAT